MSEDRLHTAGWFIDLGGLWVKYDTIGTIKQVSPTEDNPYCQVVLTLPGYKTLGVSCEAVVLITAIERLRSEHEMSLGRERAKGMRG
jgi:hypothetical protein